MLKRECFELCLREITDRWILESGYSPHLVEESIETKLNGLELMKSIIEVEIRLEENRLRGNHIPRFGVVGFDDTDMPGFNPGGTT